MYKALSEWFRKVRSINVPVNGPIFEEKARYFAKKLGHENLKASSRFLDSFKERQGITSQVFSGEETSVDPDIVGKWSEHLLHICCVYDPKDRFNADEKGYCGKLHQHKPLTLRARGVSIVKNQGLNSWGKHSKERVTIMMAYNQDGTEKLLLLLIEIYAKPRCSRGSNMDLPPSSTYPKRMLGLTMCY